MPSAVVAVFDRQDPETTARLELRALERMVDALCCDIEQWVEDTRRRSACRETEFQLQAFVERRARALQFLRAPSGEPCETRIAQLERLVEALGCSRAYFRATER
jgi:hypothetical protein